MEFVKPLMTIKELGEMGFSERLVREIALEQGFPIMIREGGKTAAIKIDTAEFWKYISKVSKMKERN